MAAVLSFDVFDTVLTRLVATGDDVFLECGRRLHDAGVITVGPAAYAAVRAGVLQDLTPDPGRHPSLAQVADEVAARLGVAENAAGELVESELRVELDVCRAVPGAAARLAVGRRQTGRGVVFVSDTPLPATFLEGLLRREQLFLDGDRLFTSAGEGASKQQGRLFDLVSDHLGVPGGQIHHVGDDRWSDVAHARAHGWSADLADSGVLSGREVTLARTTATTDGLGARLAGAARFARLQAASDGIDEGMARIAGGVALPLLVGFGLWTLQQARLRGLDRLYFIARDGEIFRDVTTRLAQSVGNGIECRYLYGSRRSWQLAARGTEAQRQTDDVWLPDGLAGADLTARRALALADMDQAEAAALVRHPLLEPERVDLPLGDTGWRQLRALLVDGELAAEADRRAVARRDLLIRYLDQEEVTAAGRVGFVDVGWTGRAARALEDVLLDADRPVPAQHLFLGLLDPAAALMGPDLFDRSRGWLIDEVRGRRSHTGSVDPVMLVESFAMGSEGNTLGLALHDETVVPVLRAARNEATTQWGFADYRRSLRTALDALCDGPALDDGVDLRAVAWTQLLNFWRRPTRVEARAWGAQPYSEDFANAELHPLATPVTGRRMAARVKLGRAEWRQPTYWLPGTVALSPAGWRAALTAAAALPPAVARARRIPARLRAEVSLRRGVRR